MNIQKVAAVYFSPTGNARKVACAVAAGAARQLNVPVEEFDITLPAGRAGALTFPQDCFVVLAVPTYASRIPNKLLPYLQDNLRGENTPVLPIAVYGNRSFGDCLSELCIETAAHGFRPVAAASVPTEHVFDPVLATGRPNAEDLAALTAFGAKAAQNTEAEAVTVPGNNPVGPYYTPLGTDGLPAKFLKAKPLTKESCDDCGRCIAVCPMGSIDADCRTVSGVCIKCQACVKICPRHAKYFTDPAFLSHVEMLKQNFTARQEIGLYL